MHPQAVIIDSSATEESYFLSGVRDKIRDMESTLIELSEKTAQGSSWLSKLDSSALAGKTTRKDAILVFTHILTTFGQSLE